MIPKYFKLLCFVQLSGRRCHCLSFVITSSIISHSSIKLMLKIYSKAVFSLFASKTIPLKTKVPILWVLGGPGSGKGVQCNKIARRFNFCHISSGELLRHEVEHDTPTGQKAGDLIERGELVPLQLVVDMVKCAMQRQLTYNEKQVSGFLIDGCPLEKEQAIMFEQQIAPVTSILYLKATDSTLIVRILERGKTSERKDDKLPTIRRRVKHFRSRNDEIMRLYKNKTHVIDAEKTIDEVFLDSVIYINKILKKQKFKCIYH